MKEVKLVYVVYIDVDGLSIKRGVYKDVYGAIGLARFLEDKGYDVFITFRGIVEDWEKNEKI